MEELEQINRTRIFSLANIEDVNAYNYSETLYSGTKYVYFGKDNDYPDFLRTMYLTSPTNQAIIDGTKNLATGEGIEVVDPAKNPLSNKWLNSNMPKDVVKSLIGDLKLYGFCALQVYDGSIVKYTEAIKYRYDKKDEYGRINNVWFSNDWMNYSVRNNRPVKIPIYKEGYKEELSIAIVQLSKIGYEYYSPVDYNGGLNYINLEAEISKYHLSNIKNGLHPSFLINFIGTEFSNAQMNDIEKKIDKKWGGSAPTGRGIISFSASKDDATTITTINQPNLTSQYDFLSKEASEKILLAHGVSSPLLFGIRDTGGGLGSNSAELENAFYLYYESELKHYQNYILELVKRIMNGNLLYADIQFNTVNPFKNNNTTQTLQKVEPLNELSTQQLLNDIDKSLVKIDENDILISDNIFCGEVKPDCLYNFIKSSDEYNMISKKFDIEKNKGFLFSGTYIYDLIKNTKDYYFMEQKYIQKN